MGPALESTEHWTWGTRGEGLPWRAMQISSNREKVDYRLDVTWVYVVAAFSESFLRKLGLKVIRWK